VNRTNSLLIASLLAAHLVACADQNNTGKINSDVHSGKSLINMKSLEENVLMRPLTDDESQEAQSDVVLQQALREVGTRIDAQQGLVYFSREGVYGFEISFPAADPTDGSGISEVIYQQLEDSLPTISFVRSTQALCEDMQPTTPTVASDDTTSVEPESITVAAARQRSLAEMQALFGLGCGSWSSWTFTGTHCGPRFWCFGQSQQGTYATFQRHRFCKSGMQVANRTDFVGCGC
jgi:hypothetical protein